MLMRDIGEDSCYSVMIGMVFFFGLGYFGCYSAVFHLLVPR